MMTLCRMAFPVLFLLAGWLGFQNSAGAAGDENIVAVVNDEAITLTDLEGRMQLIIVSSGMPNNDEIRQKIAPQILSTLIEEQLKFQEAKRLEIEVTPLEIDGGFLQIAQSNNMNAEQFNAVLERSKVSQATLRRQIEANLAWSKIVQKRIQSGVMVNDTEVDDMLARLKDGVGKTEYLVSEIFLPVETPKDEPSVRQLADKITRELVSGKVPFPQVAGQFSQSSSASQGGSLGWVQEGQLEEDIDNMLSKMEEGDVSKPIRATAGFYIIALRKKRAIAEENMPSADQVRANLGMKELERRAQRYLLDLKTDAFIERRI